MSYDNPFANATVAEVSQPDPKAGPPASERQLNYIRSLAAEREFTDYDPATLTGGRSGTASALIEKLLSMPKVGVHAEPSEGFHEVDGKVYKVQVAHHGSGRKYAKVLNTDHGGFEYVGRSVFPKLSEDTLLTLERAKELGHLYGMCCICGATLTDERSITAGIGPVCASKF